MEPVDSLPLLLSRLTCLWPAEDETPLDEPGPIPGLVDETN